jgi:ketosteroid isomerase-like protein
VSLDENKDLIRRYIEAIDDNQTSDWSILDEYIAEDFVAHNPLYPGVSLDREGMEQGAEIFRVATPCSRHEIRMQGRGGRPRRQPHRGPGRAPGELLGIPATNREVETDGIAIHRVRDGRIVEYWSVVDVARVLQQVGALPGPPAQRDPRAPASRPAGAQPDGSPNAVTSRRRAPPASRCSQR